MEFPVSFSISLLLFKVEVAQDKTQAEISVMLSLWFSWTKHQSFLTVLILCKSNLWLQNLVPSFLKHCLGGVAWKNRCFVNSHRISIHFQILNQIKFLTLQMMPTFHLFIYFNVQGHWIFISASLVSVPNFLIRNEW